MDSPTTLRTEADYRAALQRVRIIWWSRKCKAVQTGGSHAWGPYGYRVVDLKAAENLLSLTFSRLPIIFQAQPGEPEFDELDSLATLIEAYEALHYPMLP